jgi:hypothetical protein
MDVLVFARFYLDTEDLPFSPPISLPSHRLVPLLGLLLLLVPLPLLALLLRLLVLHLLQGLLRLLVHQLLVLRRLAILCHPSLHQLKRPYVL